MKYKRRKFIKTTGLMTVGSVILPWWACQNNAPSEGENTENANTDTSPAGNLGPFGIQLYTLRSEMDKDAKNVIRKVAEFGYAQAENYEGQQGLWWSMDHKEYKALCDEVGLSMISSHCNFAENFEEKVAQAAEVGMKYLIAPWVGPQKKMDDFKRISDTFNQCGEICRKNGMRFAYHNHDYSFKELEGQLPQDVMMQNTNPELVDFEMDMYWVVTAGADPIAWLNKYPGRWKLCHVKDRDTNAPANKRDASCILGQGAIDYTPILKTAKAQGMDYFIVEQELYENSTPFDSAKADAEYMRAVVI